MSYYIDTSAFIKLVFREQETPALRTWASAGGRLASSELLRIEAMRAGRRKSGLAVAAVREALHQVEILAVSSDVCRSAGEVDPLVLRSLDALHLATALSLGDDLEGVLTYDDRLAEACAAYGLKVIAPGP